MKFYAPTKVYLEKNSVRNHSQELASLGSRAIIITGRHSAAANGSLQDVTDCLKENGVSYLVFNEVEENPSVDTVARAAEVAVKEGADFVIGIGGGSPLDAAKGVAIMAGNPEEGVDCLYEKKPLKPLPFVAVPTTCGTGSEVTPNAVLTRPALNKKGSMSHNVNPDLALVDGKYLASASRNLLINTSVDALSHSIEARLHSNANEYNHMFSEYALRIWSGLIPYLTGQKEADEDIYQRFMLSSTIAGMAIAQTATSLPHALSYPLTLDYQVAHGRACGLFEAAYMEEYARNKPEDVECVLNLLGFADLDAFDVFMKELLGSQAIAEEDFEKMADSLINSGKTSTYPFPIDREGVMRIMRKSLTAL